MFLYIFSTDMDWPGLGSLCRVRVCLRLSGEKSKSTKEHAMERFPSFEEDREIPSDDIAKAMPTTFPRCLESVLQVPLGHWTVLRLGEGQCDVTESCVERMRAGEKCEVRFSLHEQELLKQLSSHNSAPVWILFSTEHTAAILDNKKLSFSHCFLKLSHFNVKMIMLKRDHFFVIM